MPEEFRSLPITQTLIHRARFQATQALDMQTLIDLAESSGAISEVLAAVGETVVN